MQPLVSVILPCYNAEKYLSYAMDSIIAQDYQNLEILCINDGSIDSTSEILKLYQQKDARIMVLHNEKNIGLISTLNKALVLAKGKYFARMDADDYSMPHRISTQVAFMEQHPEIDIVSTAYLYFTRESEKGIYVEPIASKPGALKFLSLFCTPLTHASIMARHELVASGHYIYNDNYPYAEDFELFSRLAGNGIKMTMLTHALYKVRLHEQSVSVVYNKVQHQTNVNIVKRNLDKFLANSADYSPKLLGLLACRVNTSVSFKELKLAFSIFDKCLSILVANENPEDLDEIEKYLSKHQLNIWVQVCKQWWHESKTKSLTFMFRSFPLLSVKQWKGLIDKISS